MSKQKTATTDTLAAEAAERSILVIRGQKVLVDEQLAAFYEVPTKVLVQAVKRNVERFPLDFMFQLTKEEWEGLGANDRILTLRSQIVTSKPERRGGRRYAPYAFTEQGVAMLSSVLHGSRAVEINIQIMRAFVRLRQLLSAHKELSDRLTKLEEQMRARDDTVDQQFRQVFALLDRLFNPPIPAVKKRPIGFHANATAEVPTSKTKARRK